jgi:hypothetical protein
VWSDDDKMKKSLAGLKYYETHEHHHKGVLLDSLSEDHRLKIAKSVVEHHDQKGRKSTDHQLARNRKNKANYRARQIEAVTETTDLNLIQKIYEHCPNGYHVDHITALAIGGKHHQDNLQYLPASENCRKSSNRDYDQSLAIRWQGLIN